MYLISPNNFTSMPIKGQGIPRKVINNQYFQFILSLARLFLRRSIVFLSIFSKPQQRKKNSLTHSLNRLDAMKKKKKKKFVVDYYLTSSQPIWRFLYSSVHNFLLLLLLLMSMTQLFVNPTTTISKRACINWLFFSLFL